MYKNLIEGAEALLGKCVSLLEENNVNYVIMGGWSPFLLNNNPTIHPGTKDVDILFETGYSQEALKDILKIFAEAGFLYSAKHHFQLLKEYEINGHKFIYNVDLIHPIDSLDSLEFVNHLEVPVRVSAFVEANYSLKTISLPGGDVFFKLFNDRIKKKFTQEDGEEKEIEFSLLNEAGLIISKCKSFTNTKRQRDAFDIYLSIAQSRNYSQMIKTFRILKNKYPEIYASLNTLYKLSTGWDINRKLEKNHFYRNVKWFYEDLGNVPPPLEEMKSCMEMFFYNIRFQE